jgi:hypothetical protein
MNKAYSDILAVQQERIGKVFDDEKYRRHGVQVEKPP